MLKISENDKFKILNSFGPTKLNINGINYFVKYDPDYAELVGEEIAKFIGLKCAHYEPIVINDRNYVASLDLDSEGEFNLYSAYNNGNLLFNLYNIWHIIEENFVYSANIMHDITLMYIFDLLLMNSDRNFDNFGIFDGKHIAILDNQFIFDHEMPPEISSIYGVDDQEDSYSDLENYLNNSSSEFINEFILIFNSLSPEKFNELLMKVEKERKVVLKKKIEWQFLFRTNYERIKEIVVNYRGEKNAR